MLGGRGPTARSGALAAIVGSVATSGLPASDRLSWRSAWMRENNLLSPHRCRRRSSWQSPMNGEDHHSCPEPHVWGTDGVHGCSSVDDGWGWHLHRASSILEAEVCRLECLQARRSLHRPLQPIRPHGTLPGCMARPRSVAGSKDWLCGWITAPSIESDQSFAPTRSSSGHPSNVLRPSSPSPRPTKRRDRRAQFRSHNLDGTDHPWSHLPQHRHSCGMPSATSSNSTMPSGSSKKTAT